jgi:hypothetical protein
VRGVERGGGEGVGGGRHSVHFVTYCKHVKTRKTEKDTEALEGTPTDHHSQRRACVDTCKRESGVRPAPSIPIQTHPADTRKHTEWNAYRRVEQVEG